MDAGLELKYLEKLGKSDHAAFDALFTEYYPKVKSFLAGFVKDREIASDLTQDLFFKIWINRENISGVISFKAYLFRMARNMIYDYYEHLDVMEKYDLEQQDGRMRFYSMEEELHARELDILIEIVIDRMPPQRRRIFRMSRKEHLSNDEIADMLKINKRTVENHITQALQDIRRELRASWEP
ncbi:MAG: RNA polymerase sigma-70 factor [Tannerella sp.]|jgi:RNA polymerase sigma-70 factor (ECF subfamily)|nr:RNA polymerase sigma-70 factor [Tannerella sp.]